MRSRLSLALFDMGFDVVYLKNLHPTFSIFDGTTDPGCGAVFANEKLAQFLPKPRVIQAGDSYPPKSDYPQSINRFQDFYVSFAVMMRAFSYISTLGIDCLRQSRKDAILKANYLWHLLSLIKIDPELQQKLMFVNQASHNLPQVLWMKSLKGREALAKPLAIARERTQLTGTQ